LEECLALGQSTGSRSSLARSGRGRLAQEEIPGVSLEAFECFCFEGWLWEGAERGLERGLRGKRREREDWERGRGRRGRLAQGTEDGVR